MTEPRFIEKNEEGWRVLEGYNARLLKRGIKSLSADEVRGFARSFRLASHHLAYAKTHFPHGQALPYLNRVVGVAHNFFYVRERGAAREIWRYFTHTFPALVRETWKYSAAAFALFFAGIIFAALYGGVWPQMLGDPQTIADNLGPPEGWDGTFMTAFFVTNNTRVAINAFVWGIFAGVGTVYVLIYNGIIIGALFGFLHTTGADMVMAYSLILPHGVPELLAIFLSGGAGLMLGKALLVPGVHSRKHSLIVHARKAAMLVPGIAFLMLVAAFIEGFFTPLGDVSPVIKLVFAVACALGLAVWLMRRSDK